MLVKPIYEFLVWDNCLNNCQFCFQRSNPRLFTYNQQKNILQKVLQFLQSSNYQINSHVLIVGGELFDDINRQTFLYSFFNALSLNIVQQNIDLLYINTNLIYSRQILEENLFPILDIFEHKKIQSHIKIATSFDLVGRFKSIISKQQFLSNLQYLTSQYHNYEFVVNIILTDQLCNSILNKTFDVFKFMNTYNVKVNFIPYIILDNNLASSRGKIISTLQYLASINAKFVADWLHNIDLKQPRKMFYCNKNMEFIGCECGLSTCGHSQNFKLYSNSKSCFVCDMKEALNVLV